MEATDDKSDVSRHGDSMRSLLSLTSAMWHLPGKFGIVDLLGRCALRCVLFHNISNDDTPFTRGIRVNVSPEEFETKLQFLAKHYSPVGLDEVIAATEGRSLPPRAVLVTFDDAYASFADIAAPLCAKYRIPAVFFINAAFIDNQRLAGDNLICYVASERGMETIIRAARDVMGEDCAAPGSVTEVFQKFLPSISLRQRESFLEAIAQIAKIKEQELAAEAALYLTREKVSDLARFGVEVGNHTYSHVHCRCLTAEDMAREIERNKSELQAITGRAVRSFSVPYGSSKDLSGDVALYLRNTGHQLIFLSESVANREITGTSQLDRVSTHEQAGAHFFGEIEVLPRLRAVRNRMRGIAQRSPAANAAPREGIVQ